MFKKFIIVCLLIASVCFFTKGAYASNVTYLVDTPTYSILDYGSYDVLFRVFSGGGVLAKLNFGVFQILNLGVSWELGSLIGCYDVVVTARGPAGEKSKAVQIFVKSTEIRVDITSPTANQDIETGKVFDLSAVTKGAVKSVRWKMVDKSTARPVPGTNSHAPMSIVS